MKRPWQFHCEFSWSDQLPLNLEYLGRIGFLETSRGGWRFFELYY
jgi:hypothetical protein